VYEAVENASWRIIDDEGVILDTDSGHYYTLNHSAAFIWNRLVESRTIEDIAAAMARCYRVDADQARADAEHQVGEWLDAGLIRPKT